MAANRVFAYLGAGFTGSFLYDNLDDVTRVGGGFLRALARQQHDAPPAAVADPSIRELQLQIAALASQLSSHAPLSQHRAPLAPTNSSHGAVATVTATAGVACVYLAASGVALSDLAWVTRGAFRRASKALATGVKDLSTALQRVREETKLRLDRLAARLDDVDECVKRTETIAEKLGEDIAQLHAKVDRVHAAQGVTNAGVRLLCAAATAADPDANEIDRRRGSARKLASGSERDLDEDLVAIETTLRALAAP
ncbi:predicted protein [Micromonas commoda]|uniref:DUF1664 domain-containing protein n=1 Tax=Micromonas commoda (strain RCC299 / NOUM17 / CCMP2709) TaxID=296587 RepID=C1FGH4_MICCC|nr:predicted protein [Micromonas commoda]ACO69260.1 predicted protein [Micromonas commoda]|eukprot:XP_002508002.1 predicted protein [Micromonas commoda]